MAPTKTIHIRHRQNQTDKRSNSEKNHNGKVSRHRSLPSCTRLNKNELKTISMRSFHSKISPTSVTNFSQNDESLRQKSVRNSPEFQNNVLETSLVQLDNIPNESFRMSPTSSRMSDASIFAKKPNKQPFGSKQRDHQFLLKKQIKNLSNNLDSETDDQYFTKKGKDDQWSQTKKKTRRQKYWGFKSCYCTPLCCILCLFWSLLVAALVAALLVAFLWPRGTTTAISTTGIESIRTTIPTTSSSNITSMTIVVTNFSSTSVSSTIFTMSTNLSTLSSTTPVVSTFSTTVVTNSTVLSLTSPINSTLSSTTTVPTSTTGSTSSSTTTTALTASTTLATSASTTTMLTSTTVSTSSSTTTELTTSTTTTELTTSTTTTELTTSTTVATSSSTTTTGLLTSTSTSTTSTSSSSTTTTATGICSLPCLNGGVCILPNNTCQCDEDVWIGNQCQTPVRILWKFDNNLLDYYDNFPGTPVNSPSYRSPGIDGHGTCLYLNGSANQSVIIPTPPFLNMAYTSFSLSAWVRPNTLRSNCTGPCCDNAVFGQANQNTLRRSLHIIVRDRTMYFGFWRNDTEGIQSLQPNAWFHMVYVYDYSAFTQLVYLNGILDNIGTLRGPYQGLNGSLTIGTNAVCPQANHWDGCLDLISYFPRVKSAAEVLRDATLTVSYTFNNNTLTDDGPLSINGTSNNIQYTTAGRVGSALNLSVNASFVRASGLVYLGTDGHPYSISLWIQPTVVTRGSIVHVSPSSGANIWSMPMLGFSNTSRLMAQACSTSGSVSLTGPTVVAGVWTHIAVTYAANDRFRLWVNGSQVSWSASSFVSSAMDAAVALTLGNSPVNAAGSCSGTSIAMGQYRGLIDEFQLYSRALNGTEISNLATP